MFTTSLQIPLGTFTIKVNIHPTWKTILHCHEQDALCGLLLITKIINFKDFKGCVRYIFASLFYLSKRKQLWNKKNCFLFYLQSSLRSWDSQILSFQMFKVMTSSNAQAWNMEHILLNNLVSKYNLIMKFGQFM